MWKFKRAAERERKDYCSEHDLQEATEETMTQYTNIFSYVEC